MIEKTEGDNIGIKVQVKMKDGKEYIEEKSAARDWVTNPIGKDKILAKFWHQVEFSKTVKEKNARKLLDLIEHLEDLDDVSRIVRLLTV